MDPNSKLYDEFIDYLSENQSETPNIDEKKDTETHHILCKFDGGLAIEENEIELYKSNHILAHII